MLWAIDVGNTHTVVGLNDGTWRAVWRIVTDSARTEDELAATLRALCQASDIPFEGEGLVIASVVPQAIVAFELLAKKWLHAPVRRLSDGASVGVEVRYQPPNAVGADRIANTLAALELVAPPIVVVDFGTATTFDCIDASGAYLGGAILPGALLGIEALARRTAKLPSIELECPEHAVGRNTVEALQSGLMFGYASAIDGICDRVEFELGSPLSVLATGGLGKAYMTLSRRLQRYEPNLTLDGLAIAWKLLR